MFARRHVKPVTPEDCCPGISAGVCHIPPVGNAVGRPGAMARLARSVPAVEGEQLHTSTPNKPSSATGTHAEQQRDGLGRECIALEPGEGATTQKCAVVTPEDVRGLDKSVP